jgi:long-chain acyl-CoA synthetase
MAGREMHPHVRHPTAQIAPLRERETALDQTLPGLLAIHARERPDRVALREKRLGVWRELTWREYEGHVRATACALAELGVRAGDHVAIASDNRAEWLFVDLAAQALGARSVGIYQTNPPADVAYVLRDSGSVVLFAEDQEQVDKAVAVAAETPAVRSVIVFEPRGTADLGDPRIRRWDDFLSRGKGLAANEPRGAWQERLAALDPDAPSMVVYTSGTTGPPKGAMISSRNVLEVSKIFSREMGYCEDDSILSYLPLCHVAEKILSLFVPLLSGAVVHFGEALETVQTDLREVSPTIFLGVPRIWEKMNAQVAVKMQDSPWLPRALFNFFSRRGAAIAARRRAGTPKLFDRLVWRLGDLLVYRPLQERLGLRRCRYALAGAAPISPDLIRWFHGLGVDIVEGYGQTECSGISHVNRPGKDRIGTVGTPLPLVEVRIADDGEVLVRGPNVFRGYLNQPEATAATVDPEGWLHTGDLGEIDAGGYLTITGRKKDLIITAGGKNLSPEKIENALKTSPYIKEAISIGDRRRFVTALIQIELDTVGSWATRRGIPYTSFADLAAKHEVVALISGAVDAANELLAPVEQVKVFRLLPKELTQDDGELTATQKVRRREVMAAFGALIEGMYRGGP